MTVSSTVKRLPAFGRSASTFTDSVLPSTGGSTAVMLCAPAADGHRIRTTTRYNLGMNETAPASAALFDAIKAGDVERVKAMVSAEPALLNARGGTGESAILT